MRDYDNQIVAVRYTKGKVSHVKLDCGEILTIDQAIGAATVGDISNVSLGANKDGNTTLRSKRDYNTDNNFASLPRF